MDLVRISCSDFVIRLCWRIYTTLKGCPKRINSQQQLAIWNELVQVTENRKNNLDRENLVNILLRHGDRFSADFIRFGVPVIRSWRDLRYVSRLLSYLKDDNLFVDAIRKVDPKIDLRSPCLEITSSHFHGNGRGHGSLNAYRKISSSRFGIVFEKVYLKSSGDYQRVIESERFISENIGSNYCRTPEIVHVIEGDVVVVVWFRFARLVKEPLDKFHSRTLFLLSEFYRLSNLAQAVFQKQNLVFLSTKSYISSKKALLGRFGRFDDFVLSCENKICSLPMVLGHGDLHQRNYCSCVLIDLDRFGFYPPGFDLARMIYHTMPRYDHDEFERLSQEIAFLYSDHDRDGFCFSFWFFVMVFYSNRASFKSNDFELISKKLEGLF